MKQKLWQLQKKKLWYSQLNITACFQAILDPITIVIRLSKIVFCKALMSFETSIDGSRKKGADIKSQMLWDISFLQIHHVHHLKFLRCWAVKTLVTSHLTPQPSNLLDYVMMLCVCVCVCVGGRRWLLGHRHILQIFRDFSVENTICTIESCLHTSIT